MTTQTILCSCRICGQPMESMNCLTLSLVTCWTVGCPMWGHTVEDITYAELDLALYIEPTGYFAETSQEAAQQLVFEHYAFYKIPAAEWFVCHRNFGPALVPLMVKRGYPEIIVMCNPEKTVTLVGRLREEVRQP